MIKFIVIFIVIIIIYSTLNLGKKNHGKIKKKHEIEHSTRIIS